MGTSVRHPSSMRPFKALSKVKQLPASVKCLLALDIIFCLAYVLTHLIAPDQIIGTKYWDLDDEGGIATWYSTFKLLGIGIISALFVARKMAQGRGSAVLLGLPAIFLAMGIDEIARLHERIGKYSDIWLPAGSRANTPFQETGIWIFLVGIPFILFFLWWVYQLRKKLVGYGFEIKMMVTGVFLLLSGALGVELISNFLHGSAAQAVGILLEEGLEMLGATVIFWAVLKMLKKKQPATLYETVQKD